jgi:hypothetical protein
MTDSPAARGPGQPKLAALLALALALWSMPARAAQTPVDLELVLAVDVSSSVSRHEYGLQMQGLAAAFRDPEVLAAIRDFAPSGIAVALMQWGGVGEQGLSVPWRLVRDAADGEAVAAEIDLALRRTEHGGTALGDAMLAAGGLFRDNGFAGQRRVIDVSGDGRANLGARPEEARRALVAEGITINGLAILNEEPELDRYYGESVIGGEAAFLMTADDYADFARALRAKLVREVTGARIAGSAKPGIGLAVAISPSGRADLE